MPTGWVIIAVLGVIIAFDSFRSGAARAAAISLALPAAMLLHDMLSQAIFAGPFVAQNSSSAMQIGIFIILAVGMFVLANRMIGVSYGMGGSFIASILAALATVAIILVVWLSVPTLSSLYDFGAQINAIFAEPFRFWWLLISYALIAFARS